MEGVSIIICFYNAANRLKSTLEHILNQNSRTHLNTELILVDNASNDNSIDVINEMMMGFTSFTWKIVHEKTPGLANARLCGLKNAAFDILLYCDDDNWLDVDYVNKAELILRNDSSIAILGGLGRAISSIPIPDWFENVQNYYAVGPQMPASGRVIGSRNVVYGAGMLIRKAVFEELLTAGFVFQSLGRTKSNLNAGEDSELCLAVQIMGYHIYYDDSLTFSHYIEPKRLTEEYFNRMKIGMGLSSFYGRFYRDYFFGKRYNVSKFFWVKELFYVVKDLTNRLIKFKFNNGRHMSLITFLLKERGNYDKRVAEVLLICKQLIDK